MIIHQYSLFSFDEILKFQPETQLLKIFDEIDFSKLKRALGKKPGSRGLKGYSISSLLAALVSHRLQRTRGSTQLYAQKRRSHTNFQLCFFIQEEV
jgi:hypothetical protein